MKFKIYLSSLGLITETTWNVIDWFADVQGKICLDPLVSMQKKNIYFCLQQTSQLEHALWRGNLELYAPEIDISCILSKHFFTIWKMINKIEYTI
jgi:hypothetical protein